MVAAGKFLRGNPPAKAADASAARVLCLIQSQLVARVVFARAEVFSFNLEIAVARSRNFEI